MNIEHKKSVLQQCNFLMMWRFGQNHGY